MDDARFDVLTRRLVLGGIAGGSLASLLDWSGADTKRKKRRKNKNKQKQRCTGGQTRCGNRCCPGGERCENQNCIASCDSPFFCNLNPVSCGGSDDCLCTRTVDNASVCADGEPGSLCADFPSCSSSDKCPSGRICVLCSCDGETLDHRCLKPCPAG